MGNKKIDKDKRIVEVVNSTIKGSVHQRKQKLMLIQKYRKNENYL